MVDLHSIYMANFRSPAVENEGSEANFSWLLGGADKRDDATHQKRDIPVEPFARPDRPSQFAGMELP
jgi:hypothetical protein